MEWLSPVHPESLLARLQTLPDPRRRQGRRYPLPAIVGLLVLAAMHGETSVRGRWLWGCLRWETLWAPLGFWTPQRPPTLTTVWGLLARLDAVALDAVLSAWSSGGLGVADGALSIDGKGLRGTQRAGQPARKVVAVVSHERAVVLGQREAPRGDERAAALAWLREMPLGERGVTMDAGLLQRSVLGVIVAHGGAFLGVLKANQPGVADAVTTWLQEELSPLGHLPPPASETWTKAHGRVEQRTWWVVAAGELGPYLAREFGWPDVQPVGWVRRRWRHLTDATWRGDETRLWITNLPGSRAGPHELARLLRGRWTIENPVHWVRDVTWHEDRGHGRAVGVALATLRNTAINCLRGRGFALMPDGRRWLAAQPHFGWPLLASLLER